MSLAEKNDKGNRAKKRKRLVTVTSELEEKKKRLKNHFERIKEEVLNTIPPDYRSKFGQIGFSKYSKNITPVLILSPYDVPPGPVRRQWEEMYEKKKSRGALDEMSYLLYWYGASKDTDCYSYMPKKQVTFYETEKAKGHKSIHKLSQKIQTKIDEGSKLTHNDSYLVECYKEMEEDLLKDPKDRKRGVLNFPEWYDLFSDEELMNYKDDELDADTSTDVSLDEGLFKDDKSPESNERKIVKATKKTKLKATKEKLKTGKLKRGKKKEGDRGPEKNSDGELADDSEKQLKKRGRPKKLKAVAKKGSEEIEGTELADSEAEADTTKNAMKQGKRIKSKTKDVKDVSQTKTKKRKKVEEENIPKKMTKKSKKSAGEIVSKKRSKKSDHPDAVEKDRISEDEKTFKQCQQAYLPLIQKWRSAVEGRDIKGLQSQFQEVEAVVRMFSFRFMKHHNLLDLLKQTKKVLEEEKAELKKFDSFRNRLLETHTNKMKAHKDEPLSLEVEAKVPNAVESDGIGESEENSDDDEKNIAHALDEPIPSEDEKDDDFIEGPTIAAKVKETSNKATKEKTLKKTQNTNHKANLPTSEKQLRRMETKKFRDCEQKFLPLIQKWQMAIQSKDIDELHCLFAEVDKVLESFCATFMVGYELSRIFSDTKKVMKEAKCDLTAFTALKTKMNDTYIQKNKLVPSGFVPKKKVPDITLADQKQIIKESAVDGDLDGSQRLASPKTLHTSSKTELNLMDDDAKNPSTEKVIITTTTLTKSPKKMGDRSERSVASLKNPPRTSGNSGGDLAGEGSNVAQSRSTAPPKPERKKFSLGSLMRPSASTDKITRATSASDVSRVSAGASKPEKKAQAPSWVIGPAIVKAPEEDPRALALELMLQMAGHFPAGTVNVDSLARSLENSVYEWAKREASEDTDEWTNIYWAKLHALVAAISGKQEKGTLQNLILQGRFDVPDKLVTLSEDSLAASFEGRPVTV